MDIQSLIEPLSEDDPAGEDLSYDPVRQEIEAAFERSAAEGGASEDIDWRGVTQLVLTQAASTRDLWLPVYLMRSGAKAGELEVVEAGAKLLTGLLENHWSSVHPKLEDYGFMGRKSPTESLVRFAEFLGPLRKLPILRHNRLGEYSGEDFERFRANGDSEPRYGMFRALLEESDDATLLGFIDQISEIEGAIRRADEILTANAGEESSTNFQPAYDAFSEIIRALRSFLKEPGDAEAGSGGDASVGSLAEGASGGAVNGAPQSISSREDVIRAIDSITAYYARKEPGSPVPFALRRARDWVSLDFLEVLEDIAPNSLEEARRVLQNGRSNSGSDSW